LSSPRVGRWHAYAGSVSKRPTPLGVRGAKIRTDLEFETAFNSPKDEALLGEAGRYIFNLFDRRYVAYHEAGHAVATVLLRVELKSVSIERTETSEGICVSAWYPSKECVISLFAGQVAEMRLRGPDYKIVGNMGWDSDNRCIDQYLECIAEGGDVEQLRDSLKAQTEQLISANWGFVEAIASELLDGKTLVQADMDRIRALLQGT
jgi:hypothetical protein